ncbi:hypothetical protein Ais01nite_00640 [Asanoa ishikariensis]|uniref:Uncharacterized protein n=1 Tax=Asanoa ishikariensis TaxID=137265 RepID=A0A1H3TQ54_9ACTN|nr:hypothetical protein [Asanoa ishikariensis]GIF62029.1 hypothetical protein Ais01nite_00640 [Asanoa ishikariensis]SDZ52137.1 hypothetical protein SAMN05421684_6160 [Asanoa ishikariensis]
MTEKPGKHLEEEPQEKRGAKGSRDEGSGKPSAGQAERPSGSADKKSDTSVLPQDPQDPDSPNLQSGG